MALVLASSCGSTAEKINSAYKLYFASSSLVRVVRARVVRVGVRVRVVRARVVRVGVRVRVVRVRVRVVRVRRRQYGAYPIATLKSNWIHPFILV